MAMVLLYCGVSDGMREAAVQTAWGECAAALLHYIGTLREENSCSLTR